MVGVAEIEDVTVGFWSPGADTVEVEAGRCCTRPGASPDGPASFVHGLRPRSVAELEATLEATAPLARRIVLDAGTPSWVEAELVARDWRVRHHLQLVLPADRPLQRDTTAATLRSLTDGDWPAVHAMLRLDHAEEDHRAGGPPRPARHTDEALAARQGIARHAGYLVVVDGLAAGFVCSWVGAHRLGIVEDVFVHPDRRQRGVASALVAAAVSVARARGAADVAIAADPDDTPKALYRRLGFVPTAVTRTMLAPTK